MSRRLTAILLTIGMMTIPNTITTAAEPFVVYEGTEGPGKGKNIVLISGDEEYRSEEALPQLGKILAVHHGFRCTVLFAIDPASGNIDPKTNNNIPGLEALQDADLMIIATRFRNLPDDQMKYVVDYFESGRPVIGMRTATHAFALSPDSKYIEWSWEAEHDGGFGRKVLGETWVAHHGNHGSESTRGILAPEAKGHPILQGLKDGDIWGPTDVYAVHLPLPGDSEPLVLGEVVAGMTPNDQPVAGAKNSPMMPIAWTKSFETLSGKKARIFTTTMGAATDLSNAGLRRLLVNASYWAIGLEDQIAADSNVDLVGTYEPSPFKFDGHRQGVKPQDHAQ